MESAVSGESRVERGEFRAQVIQFVARCRRQFPFDLGKARLHAAKLGEGGVHLSEHRFVNRRARITSEDVEGIILLEHTDGLVFCDIDCAFVGRVFARDHPHERGFSAAVHAHDGEVIAVLEGERDAGENFTHADAVGEV